MPSEKINIRDLTTNYSNDEVMSLHHVVSNSNMILVVIPSRDKLYLSVFFNADRIVINVKGFHPVFPVSVTILGHVCKT